MSIWLAVRVGGVLVLGAITVAAGTVDQRDESHSVPQADTSFIDADGNAHVTRVVPVPATISPEAQKMLSRHISDAAVPETLSERRAKTDAWQSRAGEKSRSLYPVNIQQQTIAGV